MKNTLSIPSDTEREIVMISLNQKSPRLFIEEVDRSDCIEELPRLGVLCGW